MSTSQPLHDAFASQPAPPRVRFTLFELFVLTTLVCMTGGLFAWAVRDEPRVNLLFLPAVFGTVAYVIYLLTRWSVGTVCFYAGITVVLGLCLLSPITRGVPRIEGRKASCNNNLRNIALALIQYHDAFGRFPPAYVADAEGRPMHSWRVLLLPYLEQGNLYKLYRFDEPWDGPNNSALHSTWNKMFMCPSDGASRSSTNYLAVVGAGTVWPGSKAIRMADIKDAASNTILLVEVHNSGVHWMEPTDLDVTQLAMAINSKQGGGISSAHRGGANVAFADGSVSFLPDDLDPRALRAMLSRRGRD